MALAAEWLSIHLIASVPSLCRGIFVWWTSRMKEIVGDKDGHHLLSIFFFDRNVMQLDV
jgi:hypothetical protein